MVEMEVQNELNIVSSQSDYADLNQLIRDSDVNIRFGYLLDSDQESVVIELGMLFGTILERK